MPKRDLLKLAGEGFAMPSVDHMFNKNILNVLLDRTFSGNAGVPPQRDLMGLWMNFVRLTDKALREYDAARAELIAVMPKTGPADGMSGYLRAIDHLENCVDATLRALLNAKALRVKGYGRKGPRVTDRQEQRLSYLRNSIEHTDERLVGTPRKNGKPDPRLFLQGQPFTLRLGNTAMVIGNDVLSYKELVTIMSKMYLTVEAIRGPSVSNTAGWSNAALRTDVGQPQTTASRSHMSDYFKELTRMVISH